MTGPSEPTPHRLAALDEEERQRLVRALVRLLRETRDDRVDSIRRRVGGRRG